MYNCFGRVLSKNKRSHRGHSLCDTRVWTTTMVSRKTFKIYSHCPDNEVFLVMIALIKANTAWFNVKFLINIIFADMYDNGKHKLSGVSWDKGLGYRRRSLFVFCMNYANKLYKYASLSVCYNRIWLYFEISDKRDCTYFITKSLWFNLICTLLNHHRNFWW